MPVDAVTIAYLAGLVDGEGYIGIKKSPPRPGRVAPGYHARIQIRMIDEEAISFLSETLGGKYYREKPHAAQGRPLFCFQASDAVAERILRALLPYLRIKAVNAREVLAFLDMKKGSRGHRTKTLGTRQFIGLRGRIKTVRTMGLTDAYIELCDSAYRRCKTLNQRLTAHGET